MKTNQHSPSLAEEYTTLRDHADQTEVLATFTPGPWRIGDGGYTVFGPPSEHPTPVTIAMLLPATSRVGKSERDANARLVASAPELLEACETMLSFIEMKLAHNSVMNVEEIKQRLTEVQRYTSSIETAHHTGCAVTTRRVDLNKVRAAIAKATRE